MSNRTQNCPFCDSARHGPSKCTSNMKQKYKELIWTMVSKECPDFHSYNMKELKSISYNTPFENNLSCGNIMSRECMKKNKYNPVLIENPIPLSLSKNRMVKALVKRWNALQSCRENYHHGIDSPEEYEEDCPICYETMTSKYWNDLESKWVMAYNVGTIKTTCNHKFCNTCWDQLHTRGHYDTTTKTCPMCRSIVSCHDIEIRQYP